MATETPVKPEAKPTLDGIITELKQLTKEQFIQRVEQLAKEKKEHFHLLETEECYNKINAFKMPEITPEDRMTIDILGNIPDSFEPVWDGETIPKENIRLFLFESWLSQDCLSATFNFLEEDWECIAKVNEELRRLNQEERTFVLGKIFKEKPKALPALVEAIGYLQNYFNFVDGDKPVKISA